jgi:DNA-binding XRE family transcriptional regulator|tara:strand:- start:237 stop:401 length:165 start_codon:yes stop_codon:yes gene_type:complete
MEKQTEFKKLVDTLFKTKIEASQKLGVSRQTINNWYIGKHKVPVVIINYLRQLN